ncbi:DeoR/GlpR family DNA-binding transcription regulator [Bombilactobacillus thymidiniphilus]|uniref:DeoR/GlpR family DNA-binding transcription regulator n=1 Tax=Bombilactobacillus thymidiniphilus TaxID=2923363 RepID=A0ABY4PDX5_9LACO|nr:DeoR/GlpR family DNA-binding transcription regulator [Bombilactobacillus thymidiniphilus]UQS83737.1 DeoR/GlpR family DNA-binding transcription regulator [Bombilactobacillus thymidiniphilus]
MITERRHQLILKQINQQHVVSIKDLIQITGASESTVRRDLCDLEKQHYLTRVHGGAKENNTSLLEEPKVAFKAQIKRTAKRLIAQKAAALVKDGEVIFIDSGTTTKVMIPYLQKRKDLLVLTNSVDNATLLADQQINTIMLGGNLRISTKAVVGQAVTNYLANCHLDRAFLGTNGFDIQHGFTTPDLEESLVKKAALNNSSYAYILTDSSKYQQIRFSKFADLNQAQIITEHLPVDIATKLAAYTKLLEVTK